MIYEIQRRKTLLKLRAKSDASLFHLGNDSDHSIDNDMNSYHAALDQLIQTALASGKKKVHLNITGQANPLIEVITEDIDEQ